MPPRSISRSMRYPAKMLLIGREVNCTSSAPISGVAIRLGEGSAGADRRRPTCCRSRPATGDAGRSGRVRSAARDRSQERGSGAESGPVWELDGSQAEVDGPAVAGQADAHPPSNHAAIEQPLEVADALDGPAVEL